MSGGAADAAEVVEVTARFRERLRRAGVVADGDTVIVAVSGGRDSMTLLHLLRFTDDLPRLHLVAAHLDHAMRADSAADAAWVSGVCAGWDIPFRAHRCDPAPTTEADARRLRYGFLEDVRAQESARAVVTAHHADDQAETVLFRAVRGTGIAGLQGIRARRAGRIWRPLLPFTRAQLTRYAEAVGLSWRDDPTNDAGPSGSAPARSVIRARILPELDGRVAPGAARALAALARRAHENEAAWRSLLPELLARVDLREEEGGFSVERVTFRGMHPAVRARLLREMGRRLGDLPGEAGTRAAVEFTSSGSSGAAVPLGGGLELRRELHRLVMVRAGADRPDAPLKILGREPGRGEVEVGGCRYDVSWGVRPESASWSEMFDLAGLRFPLTFRGWAPGDRARMTYGTKKLKKLFLEMRVPSGERHRRPVLVDASGTVLWVPEVARSADAPALRAAELFYIGVRDAQSA